ncbi:MAG: hypothetical protein ACREUL_20240 [Steroidobacteraceae bacterium]
MSFELAAPEAHSVLVAGGDGLGHGPFPMTKSADGVWRVTLPPVVPGFHYYWFILDGVAVSDPASQTYFGYGKEVSGLEVPDPEGGFYALKVSRGVGHSVMARLSKPPVQHHVDYIPRTCRKPAIIVGESNPSRGLYWNGQTDNRRTLRGGDGSRYSRSRFRVLQESPLGTANGEYWYCLDLRRFLLEISPAPVTSQM